MENNKKIQQLETQFNSNKHLSLLLIILAVLGTLLSLPMLNISMVKTKGNLQMLEIATLTLPIALPLVTSITLSLQNMYIKTKVRQLQQLANQQVQILPYVQQQTSEKALLKNKESLINIQTIINLLQEKDVQKRTQQDTQSQPLSK